MLCDTCGNELNEHCYCNRTIYQQVEQKGGRALKNVNVTACPRYEETTTERKEAMRREAAWYIESAKWMSKSKVRRT